MTIDILIYDLHCHISFNSVDYSRITILIVIVILICFLACQLTSLLFLYRSTLIMAISIAFAVGYYLHQLI